MLRFLSLSRRSPLLLLLLAGWLLTHPSPGLADTQQQQTLADLPIQAQATIAATLGKDQPASNTAYVVSLDTNEVLRYNGTTGPSTKKRNHEKL